MFIYEQNSGHWLLKLTENLFQQHNYELYKKYENSLKPNQFFVYHLLKYIFYPNNNDSYFTNSLENEHFSKLLIGASVDFLLKNLFENYRIDNDFPLEKVEPLNRVKIHYKGKEFELIGAPDLVLYNKLTQEFIIVDFKTLNGKLYDRKREYYRYQLAYYNLILNHNTINLNVNFPILFCNSYILLISKKLGLQVIEFNAKFDLEPYNNIFLVYLRTFIEDRLL